MAYFETFFFATFVFEVCGDYEEYYDSRSPARDSNQVSFYVGQERYR
jgi:hypothetical protein